MGNTGRLPLDAAMDRRLVEYRNGVAAALKLVRSPSFLAPLLDAPQERFALRNGRTGDTVATHIEPAFDSARRRRGLLGRTTIDRDTAMILAPCAGVHTFLMRFPIDVIFVGRDGTIGKICRSLKPSRIAIAWGAFAAIELMDGKAAGLNRCDSLVVDRVIDDECQDSSAR